MCVFVLKTATDLDSNRLAIVCDSSQLVGFDKRNESQETISYETILKPPVVNTKQVLLCTLQEVGGKNLSVLTIPKY